MVARGYRRSGPPSGRASTTTAASPKRTQLSLWSLRVSATPCCDDRLSSGHHRRVIRPPTNPVTAIRPIKLAQVHPRDRVQHEPSEMTLRQPIPNVGRHQERLITVTTNEILSHPGMVLNAPDDTVITRQPRDQAHLGPRVVLAPTTPAR